MSAILGSIIGLLGSAIPNIFNIYKEKKDREHEITLIRLQMEQQSQGHTERLEEIQTKGDIAESTAIYRTYSTGIVWVDALNGTVRPVITYAFFILYGVVKLLQWYGGATIETLWSEEDMLIFSTIIGFYFGHRIMMRGMKK